MSGATQPEAEAEASHTSSRLDNAGTLLQSVSTGIQYEKVSIVSITYGASMSRPRPSQPVAGLKLTSISYPGTNQITRLALSAWDMRIIPWATHYVGSL